LRHDRSPRAHSPTGAEPRIPSSITPNCVVSSKILVGVQPGISDKRWNRADAAPVASSHPRGGAVLESQRDHVVGAIAISAQRYPGTARRAGSRTRAASGRRSSRGRRSRLRWWRAARPPSASDPTSGRRCPDPSDSVGGRGAAQTDPLGARQAGAFVLRARLPLGDLRIPVVVAAARRDRRKEIEAPAFRRRRRGAAQCQTQRRDARSRDRDQRSDPPPGTTAEARHCFASSSVRRAAGRTSLPSTLCTTASSTTSPSEPSARSTRRSTS